MRGEGSLSKIRDVGAKRDRRAVWRAQISVPERTGTGRSYRKVVRQFGTDEAPLTEAEAREEMRTLRLKVAQAHPKTGSARTVAGLIDAHLARLAELGKSAATLHTYRCYADVWVVPKIGTMRPEAVGKVHVDRVLDAMRAAGRAPSTVNQVRVLMSGAFKRAFLDGLIDSNPVDRSEAVSVRPKPMQLPGDETVQKLLAAAGEQGRVAAAAVRLASVLGCRRGELVALRWDHVHLEELTVDVVEALGYADGRVITKGTKRADLRLGLAIDPATVAMLRELAVDAIGPWVVSSDRGLTPWSPDRMSSQWETVRAKVVGAEKVRLHDLRHWAATTLLDAGVPLHEVSRRLGHSSMNVTGQIYAHARGRNDHANAAAIASALKPA